MIMGTGRAPGAGLGQLSFTVRGRLIFPPGVPMLHPRGPGLATPDEITSGSRKVTPGDVIITRLPVPYFRLSQTRVPPSSGRAGDLNSKRVL